MPHVAAIAADADGVFYEGARARVRSARAVRARSSTSTQFRIMSMTKMIATTAALQQVERGELDLAAPVADYVPDFADLQVLDGWDGDTPRIRAPRSEPPSGTCCDPHPGLSYWFWNDDLVKYEQVTGIPNVVPGDMDAF